MSRPTRNDSPIGSTVRRDAGNNSNPLDRPLRRESRSGRVSYGTLHNGYGGARPSRFGSAPSRGTLGEQIRRTRPRTGYNVSFGGTVGGLRIGYCAYNATWFDDNFCYPFYVFDPWAPNVVCVASPWYRYSFMPGYVNTTRVIVVNNYVQTWGTSGWADYSYNRDDRRNEALNDALDDLRDAFERNSTRYADNLIPVTGQVAIYNDGRYDYSLGADDFRDMFLDGVEQSKTLKYEITESQFRGDVVHVRARHEYEDSWGQRQVVYHMLTLQREGNGYVIREFGTE